MTSPIRFVNCVTLSLGTTFAVSLYWKYSVCPYSSVSEVFSPLLFHV